MPNAATLPLLLKQLALPSMYNNWEQTAEHAEKNNWTYPEYLTALSDQERHWIPMILKKHHLLMPLKYQR